MAWDIRGARRYYYRSRRIGDVVEKVYIGGGEAAAEAARKDAARRSNRTAQKAELAAFQSQLTDADQLAADVQGGVDTLTEAMLLTLGFHQHRGEWRRRRRDCDGG